MKVRNMISSKGTTIANQFIIEIGSFVYFQSYESMIAAKHKDSGEVVLDEKYWDYSKTTGKYRNQFLDETKKETEAKIKSGEYKLSNLN